MPLDKNMSHDEMVKELMHSYYKNGKIGNTEPRGVEHALKIANAVAYNIERSKDVQEIEEGIKEMSLSDLLNQFESLYLNESETAIQEWQQRGPMHEADYYDVKSILGDDYTLAYVTTLSSKDGKRYEAWQIGTYNNHNFKEIKDEQMYKDTLEKLKKKFPNEDIRITSRQYKYAPEQKPEWLLLLPEEVDIDEENTKFDRELLYGYIGGSLELAMTRDMVAQICHSGSNDAAVDAVKEMPEIREQLDAISDEELRRDMRWAGLDMNQAEFDSLTRPELESYLVWIAAWSIFEDEEYSKLFETDMSDMGQSPIKPMGVNKVKNEDWKKSKYTSSWQLDGDGAYAKITALTDNGYQVKIWDNSTNKTIGETKTFDTKEEAMKWAESQLNSKINEISDDTVYNAVAKSYKRTKDSKENNSPDLIKNVMKFNSLNNKGLRRAWKKAGLEDPREMSTKKLSKKWDKEYVPVHAEYDKKVRDRINSSKLGETLDAFENFLKEDVNVSDETIQQVEYILDQFVDSVDSDGNLVDAYLPTDTLEFSEAQYNAWEDMINNFEDIQNGNYTVSLSMRDYSGYSYWKNMNENNAGVITVEIHTDNIDFERLYRNCDYVIDYYYAQVEKIKKGLGEAKINESAETLKDKATKIGNNKKLLLKRLKDGLSVLKNEYKKEFKDYEYDFENKALHSKTADLSLVWKNNGRTSEGSVALYRKSKINEISTELATKTHDKRKRNWLKDAEAVSQARKKRFEKDPHYKPDKELQDLENKEGKSWNNLVKSDKLTRGKRINEISDKLAGKVVSKRMKARKAELDKLNDMSADVNKAQADLMRTQPNTPEAIKAQDDYDTKMDNYRQALDNDVAGQKANKLFKTVRKRGERLNRKGADYDYFKRLQRKGDKISNESLKEDMDDTKILSASYSFTGPDQYRPEEYGTCSFYKTSENKYYFIDERDEEKSELYNSAIDALYFADDYFNEIYDYFSWDEEFIELRRFMKEN